MKLTSETKIFLGIILASVVIIGAGVFFLSKPAAPQPVVPRDQLINSTTQTKGNASASAYLVEFSDFECPACHTAKPYVDAAVQKHTGNLLFAYRHFPLDQHQFALKAAVAAEAAAKQGKFWEAYDYLFNNQEKFSDDFFTNMGKELGLDVVQYEKDRTDENIKQKIRDDEAAGTALGVNSTPSFYLNGQKLNMSSFTELGTLVDKAAENK